MIEHRDRDALVAAASSRGIELDPAETWPRLVDDLLSKHVEPKLEKPTFILDYPDGALALREGPPLRARPRRALRVLRGGMEFANAFTELNDPDEQRARFEQQERHTAEGDEEAQPFDEDYVRALEQGMPPTGGIGVGIDRLVMLMSGRSSIREVVLFPMRDAAHELPRRRAGCETGAEGVVRLASRPSIDRHSHPFGPNCRIDGKGAGRVPVP